MSDRRMLHRWSFAALVQSAIKDNPDYQEEYYEKEEEGYEGEEQGKEGCVLKTQCLLLITWMEYACLETMTFSPPLTQAERAQRGV